MARIHSTADATGRLLSAVPLAVAAPWPAAGPTLAFIQFFHGPANAPFSCHVLLCILDPADELVAGQRCDVLPGVQRRGIGDQRFTQVTGKLVHSPTGHSRVAHAINPPEGRQNHVWPADTSPCP